jgi:DNA-directed RNA polymerase specialized sigma24 family protein
MGDIEIVWWQHARGVALATGQLVGYDDAEEITAAALAQMIKRRVFLSNDNLPGYFYRTAKFLALYELRRRRREVLMDPELLEVTEASRHRNESGHRIQPLPVGFRGDSRR